VTANAWPLPSTLPPLGALKTERVVNSRTHATGGTWHWEFPNLNLDLRDWAWFNRLWIHALGVR
jgi:hypothetical protein